MPCSHTDNSSGCNIDTETPTDRYEHNLNSRKNRSPASSGLGGDGPSAFLRPMSVAQTERWYSGGSSFAGDVTSPLGKVLGVEGVVLGVVGVMGL
jgi:hypothetical protein